MAFFFRALTLLILSPSISDLLEAKRLPFLWLLGVPTAMKGDWAS
jgi:hypothetical protein